MKANELRIGNYVWDNYSGEMIVTAIIKHNGLPESLNLKKRDGLPEGLYDCETIEPILLTEEWLVKFGFKKFSGNTILWGLDSFHIGWYGNAFATWVVRLEQENNQMSFHSQIKYVHQLQNLYFALTGNELTIKL